MEKRRITTYIIIWFIIILIWFLFCYGKLEEAYYSYSSVGSLTVTKETEETQIQENTMEKAKADEIKTEETYKRENNTENTAKDNTENVTETESEETMTRNTMLPAKTDSNIRVLLLNDQGNVYHDEIILEHRKETLHITESSPYFQKTDKIRISKMSSFEEGIKVLSINKMYGNPVYEGVLEIQKEEEGLILVNELSLETYVKGVLPGEMSAGFPMEALKAQAVCARTYAMMKKAEPAYPNYNAIVDDSISSQVYMYQERSEKTDRAVEETKSELLYGSDRQLEECYYYSTSCGKSATCHVWDIDAISKKDKTGSEEVEKEFRAFISNTIDSHLEKNEPFYRWTYETKAASDDLYDKCMERNLCDKNYGKIKDIKIICRENGGAAECMEMVCEKGSFQILGEYNIRFVLSQGGNVILKNGKTYDTGELLPSSFLTISCKHNKKGYLTGYEIIGGGFGHGIGMSQNGAKYMAQAGNNYIEILQTYYKGSYVK
ncbi:MAG: SpoIID/LytB domain-containing protein [Lachnospiraceae bacterium]|nr:SpoIID/LytB domain-containing protein [Lachnospiraceae bacterium]